MIKIKSIIILFIAFFLLSGTALATHVSVSSVSGQSGPVTTVTASTMKKGMIHLELQSEMIKFERFSDSELIKFAEDDKEIHDMDYLLSYAAGIAYGLTDDTTIHFRIPYVIRKDIRESEPPDEVHVHGDSEGIGDISLHLHQRFVKKASMDITLLAGIKMPTGETNVKDDHRVRFEAEFQPGSGSWDPFLGLAATRRFGKLSLDGNILYTLVTEGSQKTDLGDKFNYNAAVSYAVFSGKTSIDVTLEGNGVWVDKKEANGVKDDNSGGNTIYVSPGARVSIGKAFGAYVSYGIPVLQNLNGDQNKLDYRAVAGISATF